VERGPAPDLAHPTSPTFATAEARKIGLFSPSSIHQARWPPMTRLGRSEATRVTHLSPRYVAGNAFTARGPASKKPGGHLCQHLGGLGIFSSVDVSPPRRRDAPAGPGRENTS